jgi:predicted TIM-barrel fold metal-dependent hydrolase
VAYGSDWPSNIDLRRNVEACLSLPLKDATKEKILWENAARILQLDVRA